MSSPAGVSSLRAAPLPVASALIARNMAFLLGGRLATAAATVVASPVLFSTLGPSRFGIWSLLLWIVAIAGLGDLGFGSIQLRAVAQATGGDATRRARGALALGMVFSIAVGLGLLAVGWVGWPLFAAAFHLDPNAPEARTAALFLVASLIVDGIGSPWRTVLEGTQRMAPPVAALAGTTLLATAAGVALALDGAGLVGLGLATLAASIVRVGLLIGVARRHAPELRPSFRDLHRGELRALLGYGMRVQGSQAGALINLEADRFLIGGFFSPALVGSFELGSKLVNTLNLIPFCLLYAFFPAAAALSAGGQRAKLDALYLRLTRYLAAFAGVVTACLVTSAGPLVRLWVGRPLPLAAAAVSVLAPGLGIALLGGAAVAVTRAEGAPGRETRYVFATAMLNLALTAPLILTLGSVGVPTATSVATGVGTGYFLWSFHRGSGRPLRPVVHVIWKPLVAAAVACAVILSVAHLLPDGPGRINATAAVATRVGLALALSLTMLTATRFFRREDRLLLRRLARWTPWGGGAGRSGARNAPGGSALSEGPSSSWVIYMSAIDWGGSRNRQQELAEQLARERLVLFVEPPQLRPVWRMHVEQLSASLWRLRAPVLFPLGRFIPAANRLNRRFEARRIRHWLDVRPGGRLLLVDEDLASPIIGRLGERGVIYDLSDLDWTFTRRWNRWHLRRALRRGVRDADVVTCSSGALREMLTDAHCRPVELLNACDPGHFRPDGPMSERLAAITGPRLGYVGSVDERAFDAPLLAAVARQRPDWSFVLVGPSVASVTRSLHQLPNVHLLGRLDYDELPAVVRGFDVCLIPYRLGGLIDYVHPKKFYEYLAAGKPVVTTPIAALRDLDAPHRCAATADEFVSAIQAALAETATPARTTHRRSFALAQSWDARGADLTKLLERVEGRAA
ncbi:MAG: oligosaccharide flippase family protein [Solirubrobacteraceae bacterium]